MGYFLRFVAINRLFHVKISTLRIEIRSWNRSISSCS